MLLIDPRQSNQSPKVWSGVVNNHGNTSPKVHQFGPQNSAWHVPAPLETKLAYRGWAFGLLMHIFMVQVKGMRLGEEELMSVW